MVKYIFIFFTVIVIHNINSQSFVYKGNNLFGILNYENDSTDRAVKLLFNDIDHDEDLDLIVTGISDILYDSTGNLKDFNQIRYFVSVQENTGTKISPLFSARKPFMENFPFQKGYFFPVTGDLNDDKKMDFVVAAGVDSSNNLIPLYYERKNLSGQDQFNIIPTINLNLPPLVQGSFFIPDLTDIDNDGDLDILLSGFLPSFDSLNSENIPVFLFAKNVGTKSVPDFEGWYQNPYGLISNIDQPHIATIGDIDNDGDKDILSVTTSDTLTVLKFLANNPLANGKPHFDSGTIAPFGLPSANQSEGFFPLTLVDIDSDGDLDIFMSQQMLNSGEGIAYYENDLCTTQTENIVQIICEGDFIAIGDSVFYSTGVYDVAITSANNCKKYVHLDLTVNPVSSTSLTTTICDGEVVVINNQSYDKSGTYEIVMAGINGCDSIVQLNLTVLPSKTVTLNEFICSGEVIVAGNQNFSESGQYIINLSTDQGCDSMVILNLMVNAKDSTLISEELCAGDSLIVGNKIFKQTGVYEVFLMNINGCDSIIVANLSFININTEVIQSSDSLICNTNNVIYQWFDCNTGQDIPTANMQSYKPQVSSSYGVKITDEHGCIFTSSCFSFIINHSEENDIASFINIYPNPTYDVITIVNNTNLRYTEVNIINTDGRKIKRISDLNHKNVDVSDLPAGFYQVEIISDQYRVVKNLTILK